MLISEKTKNSILQIESYCNSTWNNISFTKGQTLLHIIAEKGLETVCGLILHEGKSESNRDVESLRDSQLKAANHMF